MEEQTQTRKTPECFNLKDIFTCGQCFRWQQNEDKSYTGIVKQNVIKIKQENNTIKIKSIGKDNIQELTTQYFDLERDYKKIQNKLSQQMKI